MTITNRTRTTVKLSLVKFPTVKYYRGREGVLGDEGVLVDGNITTTVIDMKIFYINELCIMLMLPNILRKIEEKLNILNIIIDYVKSAFSAILL